MKELKETEGFSVALGRGEDRMFLVSISMMLNGDTLQHVCNCIELKPEFVLTLCFSVAKENMVPGDNSFLTLHQ